MKILLSISKPDDRRTMLYPVFDGSEDQWTMFDGINRYLHDSVIRQQARDLFGEGDVLYRFENSLTGELIKNAVVHLYHLPDEYKYRVATGGQLEFS